MLIDTPKLARALDITARSIERRSTIPILSAAALFPKGEELEVFGTDMDVEISARIPFQGIPPKDLALGDPRAFARLIRAGGTCASIDTITSEDGKNRHEISCGSIRGEISNSLSTEDTPRMIVQRDGMFTASINREILDMILRVAGAVSTEETRYYLNGVYLHQADDWTYKAVATDGHRLFMGTIKLPDAHGLGIGKHGGDPMRGGVGTIIPRKFIEILKKEQKAIDFDQPVRLFSGAPAQPNKDADLAPRAVSTFGIEYSNGDIPVTMTTKTIDGTFPDYTRVIPTTAEDQPQIRVDRKELARAIDAITAGVSEKTRAIKLTFDPKGKLELSCKWLDLGFEGRIRIDAKTRVKQPFEIGYNARYLRNVCDVAQGDELSITTADAGSPGAIASPDATDFFTVLMPMRI